MHYTRQRRHGDATVTHPPGVNAVWREKVVALERELAQAEATTKPKPSAPCADCANKDREIERLRAENVNLQHRAIAARLDNPHEQKLFELTREVENLRRETQEQTRELRRLTAVNATLRMDKRGLLAKLKVREELPKDVTLLRQQLTAAKTRISTLQVEPKILRKALDEARRANPVALTKAQRNKILMALHTDQEHNADSSRKRQLTEAFQIFNGLKIRIIDKA
jgi:hypothetical protein